MISWPDVKELQKQKLNLQIELSKLLNSKDVSKDSINELMAEIKHLDNQITKILGSNEIERQKELKARKSGKDAQDKERFYALKKRYKQISKMKLATSKMIDAIRKAMQNSIQEVIVSKNSVEERKKQKVM